MTELDNLALFAVGLAITLPAGGVVIALVYAAGIWGQRGWVVPLAWGYAAYVTLNVLLFPFRTPLPADTGVGYWIFGVVYTFAAIGTSVGIARTLSQRL